MITQDIAPNIQKEQTPKSIDEELSKEFVRALCELPTVEYMHDVLAFGDFSERINFYQHWRKRVWEFECYRKSRDASKSA